MNIYQFDICLQDLQKYQVGFHFNKREFLKIRVEYVGNGII